MNGTMTLPRPAPVAAPRSRPRQVRANALPGGGWRIEIEGQHGTMHELTVHANGHVSRCDCGAAGHGVACDHRRDAADVAKALGVWHGAKAVVAELEAQPPTRGAAIEIERLRGEMWFAEHCIRRMGFALEVVAHG